MCICIYRCSSKNRCSIYIYIHTRRERTRERERDRGRERETDRQADRQTDRPRQTETEMHVGSHSVIQEWVQPPMTPLGDSKNCQFSLGTPVKRLWQALELLPLSSYSSVGGPYIVRHSGQPSIAMQKLGVWACQVRHRSCKRLWRRISQASGNAPANKKWHLALRQFSSNRAETLVWHNLLCCSFC